MSLSNSGVVTLDTPAIYASATYHSYRVMATDSVGIFRKGYIWTVFVNDTTAPVIIAWIDNVSIGWLYIY